MGSLLPDRITDPTVLEELDCCVERATICAGLEIWEVVRAVAVDPEVPDKAGRLWGVERAVLYLVRDWKETELSEELE